MHVSIAGSVCMCATGKKMHLEKKRPLCFLFQHLCRLNELKTNEQNDVILQGAGMSFCFRDMCSIEGKMGGKIGISV